MVFAPLLLTVLGSGTAEPTRRRASAGYLVEWKRGALLLDAAAGSYTRALKAGLEPARLGAILLSHLHPDHTADLAAILWARQQARVSDELLILGPEGTAGLVERFCAVYGDWLDTPFRVAGYPGRLDGLAIEAFPAHHCDGAVCLRLTAGSAVLAYSGDTADCPGLRAACRGADLALLECTSMERITGHMTPADCEAVVDAARPRRVLLTHLGPDVESSLPLAEDGLVVSL